MWVMKHTSFSEKEIASLLGREAAFRLQMLDGYLEDGEWGVGETGALRCGVKYNGAASVRWLKRVGGRRNIEKPVVKLEDGHMYEVRYI